MSWKRSGAWAKWRRAKRHFEALGKELGVRPGHAFGWSQRYHATAEAHQNGLEYRFYVDALELDTGDWPLLVGDCLFNLRSALDHLVYELHLRRFRGNVPDSVAERSAFPILTDPPPWKNRSPDHSKWKEIRSLGFKQRRAIAWLQPYNRRNDEYGKIRRSLGSIATLNNLDKHRHLHILQAAPHMAAVAWYGDPPGYGWRSEPFFGVPLVGKTEVLRWTFDAPPPDIARYLDTNGDVTAFVCLTESGETTILIPLMRELLASVATVLRRFAVFLP